MTLYEKAIQSTKYWAANAIRETKDWENRERYARKAAVWATIAIALKGDNEPAPKPRAKGAT